MTIYCTECGEKAPNQAKYCFKCGSPLHVPAAEAHVPYSLEGKYRRCIPSSPCITVEYSSSTRVWLVDGGFERLHAFVSELCALAYAKSCEVHPSESEDRCYDVVSDIHFDPYASDFYPEDGFESVFVQFSDFIPGPFGNMGYKEGDTHYSRLMDIYLGRIEHNPDHGRANVAERERPRLRKSKIAQHWGIRVTHHFEDSTPTSRFSFALTAHDLRWQDAYTPNYRGLLALLGLEPVVGAGSYRLVKGKPVSEIREASRAISEAGGSLQYEPVHEEEWRPASNEWRPYIEVTVSTGWFSSEKRRLYLPAYPGEQRPPKI